MSNKKHHTTFPTVVATGNAGEAQPTLERALEQAGFWEQIERERKGTGLDKADFRICILPDLEHYDDHSTTGTNPQLVEHLILLLHEREYPNVIVAAGPDPAEVWLENREVLVLADLAGYRFQTPAGEPYDIYDLSEEVVREDERLSPNSLLFREGISSYWLDSHFRINFAKNKTDEEFYFALGLHNLLGILPLRAKHYHYRHRLGIADVATDLLRNSGVHFTIIDAWVSNHGSQGSRYQKPLETRTFIAGFDTLLVDWLGSLKMGLDPFSSSLNAAALRANGLPSGYQLEGDLTNYSGWENVSRLVQESVARRNEQPAAQKLFSAWLQQVNTDLFPFKNALDAQVNSWLAPVTGGPDENPLTQAAMTGLNFLLANWHQFQRNWQILYDKDRLYRREVPLDIPLENFGPADYEAIEGYIRPLAQIVRHVPPDPNGLRWRYIDGSVLFEFSKIIPVPYVDFVAKVDIARAVELMYDNIGGIRQTVKKDRRGRVVYQAERDIYLPQPNWIVLFGGTNIDVGKIEKIDYGKDRQEVFWRTVKSANNSAEFDDGMVTFAAHAGGTQVTIVARQKFALPLFWQVFDIDYLPELKKILVSDAYVRFFSRTMANFEAAWEGRDPRIGKRRRPDFGEEESVYHPLETEQLKNMTALLAGLVMQFQKPRSEPGAVGVDALGYRHFKESSSGQGGTDEWRRFFKGLSNAVRKDM